MDENKFEQQSEELAEKLEALARELDLDDIDPNDLLISFGKAI